MERTTQKSRERRDEEHTPLHHSLYIALSFSSLLFWLLRILWATVQISQGKRGGWWKETLLNSTAQGGGHSGGMWMDAGG